MSIRNRTLQISLIIGMAGIMAYAFFSVSDDSAEAPPLIAVAEQKQPLQQAAAPAAAPQSSVLASPFGTGSASVPVDRNERIDQRRQRMQAWNYATPAQYFKMDLAQLTKLAKANDPYALIQLGEQYAEEYDSLHDEPGFDASADPKALAREAFTAAIHTGHNEIAAVMALKALANNDIEDALAWKMVTDTHRSPQAAMLNQYAGQFAQLTPAQKQQTMHRYRTIIDRLSQPDPVVPPPAPAS